MAIAEPSSFIREFLASFLESQLLNGRLSTDQYHGNLAALRRDGILTDVSQRLFKNSPEPVEIDSYGPLRIVYLREPDGTEFPFLQGLAKAGPEERNKLVCFVGHRFQKNIERSLRFNLIHLLEPYGITLRWSGYDLSAKDIFDDVISGIKAADLCLFDNLGTLSKPNVYIEVGIAFAAGKPMLVCEYAGVGGKRKMPDTGSVPSDLQGLFRIAYRSYEDLARQLYFGLPIFLDRHQLL
jgi:hypothetical protein